MSANEVVHVNFAKPIPVFPLNTATLLPHGIIQLYIFEPRYRQMVKDVLDGPGQIAMGVFEGERWKREYHGRPAIRPAVCIGQIVHHVQHDDGTYDLVLQGICRARIVKEQAPVEGRLYRTAFLEPIGDANVEDDVLGEHRAKLARMLGESPLTDLRNSEGFVQYLKGGEIPANVLIELLGYTFLPMDDTAARYAFLAEPDPRDRAEMVEDALSSIARLLKRAAPQKQSDAPKGCSWN